MKYVLALLLSACVIRLWIMPIWSSFWVDEMGTAFVVHHGKLDPSFRVAPQVPKSIYYNLPGASARLFGISEAAYRFPSLVVMALAVLMIAQFAGRLINPGAAWFAVFACFAIRPINYQAGDARPYALGTAAACLCVFFLVEWLKTGRRTDALAFAIAAALLWRIQLIFWPFYLFIGAYVLYRMIRRKTPVRWFEIGLVFAMIGIALVPVLLDALNLYRQAGAHTVVPQPSARALLDSLKMGIMLECAGGAWLLSQVFRWPRSEVPSSDVWMLIVGWWLCQPLGLFAFSWVTGNSAFVPRYLWLSLPGVVLLTTGLVSRFLPPKYWVAAATVVGVGALAVNGQWNLLMPYHHNSDWRGAAQKVNELAATPGTPVICPSPFVEARPPEWRPDYHLPGFLYAHLDVYRISGDIQLFPFETSPEAEAWAHQLAEQKLRRVPRFVIYGGAGQVETWRDFFARSPELSGWRVEKFGPFRDVDVVEFSQY